LLRSARNDEASSEVSLDFPFQEAKDALVLRFEREYLTALLRRTDDNLAQAARIAGLDRKHLYRVLERAGCLPPRLRKEAPDE
jgi:DNA-binding NtrC family response regulator